MAIEKTGTPMEDLLEQYDAFPTDLKFAPALQKGLPVSVRKKLWVNGEPDTIHPEFEAVSLLGNTTTFKQVKELNPGNGIVIPLRKGPAFSIKAEKLEQDPQKMDFSKYKLEDLPRLMEHQGTLWFLGKPTMEEGAKLTQIKEENVTPEAWQGYQQLKRDCRSPAKEIQILKGSSGKESAIAADKLATAVMADIINNRHYHQPDKKNAEVNAVICVYKNKKGHTYAHYVDTEGNKPPAVCQEWFNRLRTDKTIKATVSISKGGSFANVITKFVAYADAPFIESIKKGFQDIKGMLNLLTTKKGLKRENTQVVNEVKAPLTQTTVVEKNTLSDKKENEAIVQTLQAEKKSLFPEGIKLRTEPKTREIRDETPPLRVDRTRRQAVVLPPTEKAITESKESSAPQQSATAPTIDKEQQKNVERIKAQLPKWSRKSDAQQTPPPPLAGKDQLNQRAGEHQEHTQSERVQKIKDELKTRKEMNWKRSQ